MTRKPSACLRESMRQAEAIIAEERLAFNDVDEHL